VYLKLKPNNKVASVIHDFNLFLDQHHIFSTYHFKPFLMNYPLHNTLYLTEYKKEQVAEIIKRVEALSTQQKAIRLTSDKLIVSSTGYTMLTIKNNKTLQLLSDTLVKTLAPLRDHEAFIPDWAAADKGRQTLFNQVGSPNVQEFYNPHLSLLDPAHLNKNQQKRLRIQLEKLIHLYSKQHVLQKPALGEAIGVGIADDQGQIIKELAVFKLRP